METVKAFQVLATEARSETAKLVGEVQIVVDKLADVKRLFTAAFDKIPNCAATPPCSTIKVSQLIQLSFNKFKKNLVKANLFYHRFLIVH